MISSRGSIKTVSDIKLYKVDNIYYVKLYVIARVS